jgi:hypothetical protein
MNETSRRKFLAAAGAGAAAGTVVAVSGGAAEAMTARRSRNAATEPVVAYVHDPKAGVLRLMVGAREVIVEDHDLVTRILNHAGGE